LPSQFVRPSVRLLALSFKRLLKNHWTNFKQTHWYSAWNILRTRKIQVCSNEVSGVTNDHALREHIFI